MQVVTRRQGTWLSRVGFCRFDVIGLLAHFPTCPATFGKT